MKSLESPEELKLEEEKNNFLRTIKPEEIAKNFPLYILRQELARYLARYELFKKILEVKGSIVECGVYQGSALMFFAKLSSTFEPYALSREIIGFDTFNGFPSVHENDNSAFKIGELGEANIDTIKKSIEFYDRNRPIGHVSKVKLIKGDAIKTIPEYFSKNRHTIVALLYMDFDIYEPTKVALETIIPHMPKGSIIAFDELHEERWPGETIALLETMKINNYEIKKFSIEPHISYIKL